MPTVSVFDMTGKKVSDLELAESVFGIEPSIPAMHLCVVSYLANQRQGTQSTLTRAEVSGGGKKPWRQKAPAAQDRVRPELRSGITAVSLTAPSPVIITRTSIRRSEDLLSSPPSPRRFRTMS